MQTSWFCSCETIKKLYCFPFLLFAIKSFGNLKWVKYNMNYLSHLPLKTTKRECSHAHLTSILEFNSLGQHMSAAGQCISNEEHNERADKDSFELSLLEHKEEDDFSDPRILQFSGFYSSA